MNNYKLTFYEAIEKCLNNEGYIRGEQFAPGVYVENKDGQLKVMNRDGMFRSEIAPLGVSTGVRNQKYKLFSVANPKEIGLLTK